MNKLIKTITFFTAFLIISVNQVYAAAVSVKLEQPKSPTNRQEFSLTFVALDLQNRPITVRCYKKAPGEGGYSIFNTDYNLAAGGDTDSCRLNSGIISTEGTYEFYVTATAGTESVNSEPVSVEYKAGGPGTPEYRGKSQHSLCQYKVSFKTSDDNGETVKVEVYRSENKNFTASGDTRVGSVGIGSKTEGEYIDSVPDCGKTYYYAIRAFNNAGTGSSVVGDTLTTVQIPESEAQGQVSGALPVGSNQVTAAAEDRAEITPAPGQVLGEEASSPAEEETAATGGLLAGIFKNKAVSFGLVLLLLTAGLYLVFKKKS